MAHLDYYQLSVDFLFRYMDQEVEDGAPKTQWSVNYRIGEYDDDGVVPVLKQHFAGPTKKMERSIFGLEGVSHISIYKTHGKNDRPKRFLRFYFRWNLDDNDLAHDEFYISGNAVQLILQALYKKRSQPKMEYGELIIESFPVHSLSAGRVPNAIASPELVKLMMEWAYPGQVRNESLNKDKLAGRYQQEFSKVIYSNNLAIPLKKFCVINLDYCKRVEFQIELVGNDPDYADHLKVTYVGQAYLRNGGKEKFTVHNDKMYHILKWCFEHEMTPTTDTGPISMMEEFNEYFMS